MPILWRYLIIFFLKITCTCVIAFIAILLTMRLDDIAHFAALGASFSYVAFFTLNQIPYILPIALPLSCLIASLLLIQRLSHSHELTALRASGFSLKDILTPLLLTAAFLSLANFWIASELATQSHMQTNLLKSELRSINPLLLLNNKHLMRMKGFYFTAFGPSHVGESASDVIFAIPNRHRQRLHLMIARQLKSSPTLFTGEGMTLLTSDRSASEEDFDHLLIENIGESFTDVQDFSDLLQKKVWTVNNDYLQLSLLLARIQEQRQLLKEGKLKNFDPQQLKPLAFQLDRSLSEIIKRLSIALAVFSLTFMGTAFGLNISRRRHTLPLFIVISLTTIYLIAFFVAKGIEHHYIAASLLYMVPHALIICASLLYIRRISNGVELCLR